MRQQFLEGRLDDIKAFAVKAVQVLTNDYGAVPVAYWLPEDQEVYSHLTAIVDLTRLE